MSTSNVASTTGSYQPQSTNQNTYAQLAKSFQAIGTALQSGDLSGAQTALAAFQQNLPGNSQTSTSQPFGKNSQANTDYQSLVSALKSGNASTAQQAYSSLQNDLKSSQSAQKSHKGHHHRGSSATTASMSATTASTPASASGTTVNSKASSTGANSGSLLDVTA